MVNDLKFSDISADEIQSYRTGKEATRKIMRQKWRRAISEQYPDKEKAKEVRQKLYREIRSRYG